MALSVPTYSVQVSFTDPFDTPDWVDITRWVKKGSTKRGRQHELQRAIAGTCSLTITNQDGRFSTFNTTSPYVNMMTGADSYFANNPPGAIAGTWALSNTTNCHPLLVANQGYDNLLALSVSSIAAGTMTIGTGDPLSGSAYSVTAGNTYGFQVQFKAATTARTCSVGVAWYNVGGSLIGSIVYATGVTDSTSVYTKATLSATAPAGATTCAIVARVAATGGANEVHYITRAMISNADKYGNASTAWAPGGRGLVPARPVKVTATASSTVYPVFYGYIDAWLPSYGTIFSDQVINASDGLTLLALPYVTTSGYKGQVLADGAAEFWYCGDPPGSPTAANSTPSQAPLLATSYTGGTVTFGSAGLLGGDTHTAATIHGGAGGVGGELTGLTGYSEANGVTLECVVSSTTLNNLSAYSATTTFLELSSTHLSITAGAGFGAGLVVFNVVGSASGVSAGSINDGLAHHLAVTWAKTTGAWVGYIDGVAVASGFGTAPGATLSSVYSFAGQNMGGDFSFTIAGIAITQTALSAAQIAVHSALSKHGFIQQQSGQRIGAILTALGVPASYQSLATGISAVQQPAAALTTTPALSHIQTVEATEQGFGYVDESGIFTYRDRHYILQNAAATVSNGTFANDNNGAHYKYLVGSLIPADDALDLWNDTPVSAIANAPLGVTGAIQDYPSTDSIRWYGKRTLTGYSSMLQTTDLEAASLSQWLKAHYGLPVARVRQMKLDSTATNPSSIPQMLGRKLLDRITVIWQPIDGTNSPFSQDSLIENIQHDFGPDLWTTTWMLSVAETQQYFTLNDANLGTLAATGALTGNRLGF